MWMEVHIYSSTSQRCNDNIKNLRISSESSAEDLRSRREHRWGYVSIYENTPEKLLHLPPKVAATLLSGSRKGTIGA